MKQIVLRQNIGQNTLVQRVNQINLTQRLESITLRQPSQPPIVLRQEIKQFVLRGNPPVANIVPFTATATENGQTVFPLLGPNGSPISFSTIICLFIMGTGQNILSGDYTISTSPSGTVATLGTTAPYIYADNLVYGAGQV